MFIRICLCSFSYNQDRILRHTHLYNTMNNIISCINARNMRLPWKQIWLITQVISLINYYLPIIAPPIPPRPAPPLVFFGRFFMATWYQGSHTTLVHETMTNLRLPIRLKTIARYFTRHSRCWTRSQKTVRGTSDNHQSMTHTKLCTTLPLIKRITNKSYTLTILRFEE